MLCLRSTKLDSHTNVRKEDLILLVFKLWLNGSDPDGNVDLVSTLKPARDRLMMVAAEFRGCANETPRATYS